MEATRATLFLRLAAEGPEREVAWAEFCARYEPIIAGFARAQGARPHQISEVVQRVVTGFFAAQPRFAYNENKGRFRSYLRACVVNEMRRQRRDDAKTPAPLQTDGCNSNEGEADWDRAWRRQCLNLALERVRAQCGNPATMQAFEAVVLRGQEPGQVAESLGISRESVYQAKSRILGRLLMALREIDEELGT